MNKNIFISLSLVVTLLLASCSTSASKGPKGVLRVGSTDALVQYPWEAQTADQLALVDQIYDPLVTVDILGNLRPGVASSWKESDDKLSWTFTLGNRTFSDGSPIHASDVKSTIEKVATKTSVSPAAAVLELVHGFIDFHDKASTTDFSGLGVVDDTTLKITLDEPWADLPTALAAPSFGIASSNTGSNGLPVTSGPFRYVKSTDNIVDFVPRSSTTAVIKDLQWKHYDDESSLTSASNAQNVDVALGASQSKYARRFSYAGTLFYALNERKPVFQDANLRSTIVHAVDRHSIVSSVYKSANSPIDGVVPKGLVGWQENICGDACSYNTKSAKDSLAKVDVASLPTIHIDTDGSTTQSLIATQISAALTAIGLKTEVRPHSEKDYPTFLQSGDQEIFQVGRVAEFYSPDAVVWPLFSSGSVDNVIGFHDPALDEALSNAHANDNAISRSAALVAVEKTALGESVALPLAQVRRPVGISPRVHNIVFDVLGTFDATAVKLS